MFSGMKIKYAMPNPACVMMMDTLISFFPDLPMMYLPTSPNVRTSSSMFVVADVAAAAFCVEKDERSDSDKGGPPAAAALLALLILTTFGSGERFSRPASVRLPLEAPDERAGGNFCEDWASPPLEGKPPSSLSSTSPLKTPCLNAVSCSPPASATPILLAPASPRAKIALALFLARIRSLMISVLSSSLIMHLYAMYANNVNPTGPPIYPPHDMAYGSDKIPIPTKPFTNVTKVAASPCRPRLSPSSINASRR
mmetsp:Transcript_19717/g.49518  ORF Transcript_19717/g.49518 Transcript_19717/m.49518 type:complete len:254 (-) Transcript_19717:776-1537(-)